jgi:ferric-dicitrate binding protein FerR (iron transport regulator)
MIGEIGSVDVNKAFNTVKKRIEKKPSVRYDLIRRITRIAAMIAVPLMIFNIWYFLERYNNSGVAENELIWQEITCPIGMKMLVTLPDSSKVWLNADSKIKYHTPFVGKTRNISLTGEAFLNVKKNKESPFILNNGESRIKVLGTQFNVKSYPEDNRTEIALKEGSINFYFSDESGKSVYTRLKPNDYLTLNKTSKKVTIENKELDKYLSWYQNVLIFDETPIDEVAKTLERWYGVKVIIKGNDIANYKFTTTFENESIAHVLELLKLSSPLSIKYKSGKINKTTNKLNKSIITISKK